MADSLPDSLPDEEREFLKMMSQIGGRERIHLVTEACRSGEEDGGHAGILQEFIRDMFPDGSAVSLSGTPGSAEGGAQGSCLPEVGKGNEIPLMVKPEDLDLKDRGETNTRNGGAQRTGTRRTNIYSLKRTIDSPLILFIFTQTFVSQNLNHLCLKEILKDVKARTKRASVAMPALVGLIRTKQESAQTHQCVQILQSVMVSVFHQHPPESIWSGCFFPGRPDTAISIKRNLCKVLHASLTADDTRDRGNTVFWPFQCLFRSQRRGVRGQANSCSSRRDDPGNAEEGIPLKISALPAEPHVNREQTEGDS